MRVMDGLAAERCIQMDRWGEREVRQLAAIMSPTLWPHLTTARKAECERLKRIPFGCRVRKETVDWLDRELRLAKLAARTNKTPADT